MNAEFSPRVTPGDAVRLPNRSHSLINIDLPSDDPLLLFSPERPRAFEIAPMRAQFEAVRDSHVSTANRLLSSIVALSLVAMSLGVGILIGFAGGYASAPRVNLPSSLFTPTSTSPAPPSTAVVPPVADPVQTAPPARPAIRAEAASSPSASATNERASGVERSRSAGQARAAVASRGPGPGSIEVVSRPAGAQVAVDGRVVGTTPLTIPDVATGTHVIGIELAGFSRWATSVRVDSGERARVGASLSLAPSQ